MYTFDNCSLNSSNFCCNGVFSSSVSAISDRILPEISNQNLFYSSLFLLPISVFKPVPITIPRHLPDAIFVPYNESTKKNLTKF